MPQLTKIQDNLRGVKMASKKEEKRQEYATPKKADLILRTDQEIFNQVNSLSARMDQINEKLAALTGAIETNGADGGKTVVAAGVAGGAIPSGQLTVLINAVKEECELVKREVRYLAAQNESIYNELTERMDRLAANAPATARYASPVAGTVHAEVDYDLIAKKVVELMPAQEYISPDYIACKVAEQIVIPEPTVVTEGYTPEVRVVTETAPAVPVDVQIDEDELADKIALKVGALRAEDFDIIVDDDGCASISREIVEKLDYDVISAAVAEKLRAALDIASTNETDYEEMAQRISENITVAGINEDAIAEKAAEALSNYLPEIDTDDIADKVAAQLIGIVPAAVDSEAISNTVSEKIIENQSANDYDIVIDEDGIKQITEYVATEVQKHNDERFNSLENDLAELKAMLEDGAVIREVRSTVIDEAAYDAQYVTEEPVTLVTVSDIVEEEPEEEASEDTEDDGQEE